MLTATGIRLSELAGISYRPDDTARGVPVPGTPRPGVRSCGWA
ncbi:MAG TPA: hypothetical protein VN969_40005 [Streptosporangiaceae bacterium]|nr:hypothetical protein [Streptosporangiaceae bacterium]